MNNKEVNRRESYNCKPYPFITVKRMFPVHIIHLHVYYIYNTVIKKEFKNTLISV